MASLTLCRAWQLVQLGTNNCTVIVGFNAQLLKYFAVFHPPSVWCDRQIILTQLVSYLSREILGAYPKARRLASPCRQRRFSNRLQAFRRKN